MVERSVWGPGASGLLAVVVGVALATGCSRCGRSGAADGGAPDAMVASPAVAHGRLPATDLRSAVILIFPEYRGTYQVAGKGELERTVKWSGETPLAPAIEPQLRAKGYTGIEEKDGVVTATRDPFHFEARREGDTVRFTVGMPVNGPEINRLLYAQAPLSTEHMQVMMPKLPGGKIADDTFVLELGYVAKPGRANFLIRQLTEQSMAVGWKPTAPLVGWKQERNPDGGVGDIPLQLDVTLRQEDTGGSIEIQRSGGQVHLRYVQPVVVPSR